MKLDFIIIGGQKCASTYLHTIIGQHPEIEMVPGECPHFESPDYENGGLPELEEILSRYDQTKLIGFKRPNYLGRPEVLDRIKSVNQAIKLIVILRNPIERLKSAYFHNMTNGVGPVLPLNKGIEKFLDGELQYQYPRTQELIEFGLYAKHLKKYIKEFRSNLLILTFDELKKDLSKTMKKCYTFLGIDENYVPADHFLASRPQKVIYSTNRLKILSKKNRHRFDYNHNKTRIHLKKQSFSEKLICKSIDQFDRYFLSKIVGDNVKPDFEEHLKNRLLEIFKPDILELENMTKFDLSNWKC